MATLSVLHILRTIKERGSVSRTDLQHLTSLSWGTITNTTRELLNRNLIREEGALATKSGRKPVKLAINPASHVLVGVDIAPDSLKCLALNLAGETLWSENRGFDLALPPAEVLDLVAGMLRRALEEPSVRQRMCLGVGIAAQGALDVRRGLMRFAPRMPGWKNVQIRDHLQAQIPVPVLIEHDIHCLALAERWFGEATAADDVLCINLGEGIGMGILLNGDVYRGSQELAGEFGHITVDPNGPPCACGDRGCIESFCSTHAINEFARSRAADQSPTLAAILATRPATAPELIAAASAGDLAARAGLERLGQYLGLGVANLIDLFNPSLIVLCGPLALGREYYLPALNHQIEKHAWKHSNRQLLISKLGNQAVAMGACGIVLQSVFDQQLLAPIELLQA